MNGNVDNDTRNRIELAMVEQQRINASNGGRFSFFSDPGAVASGTSTQPYLFYPYEHFLNAHQRESLSGKTRKNKKERDAVLKFLKHGLNGKRLIDLGCGEFGSANIIANLARITGASEYVGVDPYCDQVKSDSDILRFKRYFAELVPKLKISFIAEDMLKFLSNQEAKSGNIVLNGVDYAIISSPAYIQELRDQIARVVPDKGFAMGYNSPHLLGLENYGFERIIEIPGYGRLSEKEISSKVANHAELLYRRK